MRPHDWSTAEDGYLINDGRYSLRNSANHFTWTTARLAQVASD
ncbi:hypothetical protein [Streptomyces sp. A1136]|nr:hypothetical protein [Streptomyces sp. A1136]